MTHAASAAGAAARAREAEKTGIAETAAKTAAEARWTTELLLLPR